MNNLLLALFLYQPGTSVTIINPAQYKDCKGTIVEYTEVKNTYYYDIQLDTCSITKLKYLKDTDFSTP